MGARAAVLGQPSRSLDTVLFLCSLVPSRLGPPRSLDTFTCSSVHSSQPDSEPGRGLQGREHQAVLSAASGRSLLHTVQSTRLCKHEASEPNATLCHLGWTGEAAERSRPRPLSRLQCFHYGRLWQPRSYSLKPLKPLSLCLSAAVPASHCALGSLT